MSTQTPLQLDHTTNAYFAITVDPSSSLVARDSPLPLSVSKGLPEPRDVEVNHVGPLGSLKDVQMYSVPRQEWEGLGEVARKEVIKKLRKMDGVKSVEEQVLRQRTKRDEF